MPIIFWKAFAAAARGTSLKAVGCEPCDKGYGYQVSGTGTGSSLSLFMLQNEGAEQLARGGLLLARWRACKDYDPNSEDVEARLARGQKLAIWMDQKMLMDDRGPRS